MRFPALAGTVLAVLAPLWAGTAAPAQAAAESSCDGVWVVVDYGSLGGTQTACAARHSTGAEALRSAGFSPTIDDGFLLKVDGKPGNPDPNKAYWSYWQAKLTSDGGYTDWSYSSLGVTASHPQRGNAEGWRYQSLDDGKVPPGADPPDGKVNTPTPTPSETKASPTPTKKPTRKPTATPTATRSPTASTSPTATRTATRSATPTGSASPTTTVTPTPAVVTPTPDGSPTATATGSDQATFAATGAAAPSGDDSGGSPVGAIAAGAAVVAAGAGLGGWWLLKGRKT